MAKRLAILLLGLSQLATSVSASTEFTVCSQNLQRVGKAPFGRYKTSIESQTEFLIERIKDAKCDVIGVQEVYGRTKNEAAQTLSTFTEKLSKNSGDKFISFVGESQFDEIRNGFILRENTARVLYSGSTPDGPLPKLVPLQRSRIATRKPFALLLDVASTKKDLLLVNIHFKSKVGGFKDPAGLDFETLRMESSEQAREFAFELERENAKGREVVAVILGDRNSKPNSATDSIIQGRLTLADFRAGCSVNTKLEPACALNKVPIYSPIIASRTNAGSSKFRGQEELIDEIYVGSKYLDQLKARGEKLKYGLEGEFFKGSDHKLVWLDLPL